MTRSCVIASSLFVLLSVALSNAQPDLYVDSSAVSGTQSGLSWRNAFLDLQDALDPNVAQAGDTIWVADGTYRPSIAYRVDGGTPGSRHATFRIPEGVSIYGGFHGVLNFADPNDVGEGFLFQRDEVANRTILSGDLNNDSTGPTPILTDDVYHVVTAHNTTDPVNPTKLSGFTIQFGRAEGRAGVAAIPFDRMGGGILVLGNSDQSSLIVTKCRIEGCVADLFGGGAAIVWTSIPTNPNDVRPARVVSSSFINNLASNSDPNDPNVDFGGGFAIIGGAYELTNSVFYQNATSIGGGAFIADSLTAPAQGAITNCTFTGNKGDPGGAIFASTAADTPIRNTICWLNDGGPDPNEIDNEIGGNVVVSHCDVQMPLGFPPFPGTMNINVDPLFCDGSDPNNPHLIATNSPCIDAGLDVSVPLDLADMDDDGNTTEVLPRDRRRDKRLIDAIAGNELVEIGAHEVDRDLDCPGDVDDDGDVDLTDLAILLTNFGLTSLTTCPPHPADLDADGDIDLVDLALLLEEYGCPCGVNCFQSGGGESMTSGTPDPNAALRDWLQSATLEQIMEWFHAGMPPVGGNEY